MKVVKSKMTKKMVEEFLRQTITSSSSLIEVVAWIHVVELIRQEICSSSLYKVCQKSVLFQSSVSDQDIRSMRTVRTKK